MLRRKLGIRDHTPITRRHEASIIVQRALDAGLITLDNNDPLFVDYVIKFWDFDTSDYIRRRNKKNPNSIGKDYAKSMGGTFKKNAVPQLPNHLKLSEIKTSHIENVVNALIDDGLLTNATISRVLQAMSVPLKEAKRLHIISINPMDGVESLTNRPKERGILTDTELRDLIFWMRDNAINDTFDNRVYLATALSAFTGMRQGEIRGLQKNAVSLINEEQGLITVSQAVAVYSGLKTTKGKRERQVPAPLWICEGLLALEELNPYGNSLIFWSSTSKTNPIASSYIRDQFYQAMRTIGISNEDRKKRNINFHSLRHYYVTFMRGKVAENVLRGIVGHQSSAMSDAYTHDTREQLLEAGKISEKIIDFHSSNKAQ
ncbi:MAG: tyrosine-type recombinase/integrase [Spirochaetia bacterium]|nr:tyrosine-type recombinase/integrase [Spirochaetia bacterium]MCF7953907.1 tyrosine-type recombinase/integrase [Spirochaetales bacterium]